MKLCRRCGESKSVHEFRVFKIRRWADAPPSVYRKSWCFDCENEYQREYRRRNPDSDACKAKSRRMKV